MSPAAGIASIQSRIAQIEARLGVTSADDAAFRATLDRHSRPSLPADAARALEVLGATDGYSGGGSRRGEQVVAMAREYLGVPYVWGGTDPSGFDCSGLVQFVYDRMGVSLPRVSADQARSGQPVSSLSEARAGDILAWDTGPRNVGADHVAIYAGDGMMIEAPRRGGRVQLVPVDKPPDAIRRVLPSEPLAGTSAVSSPSLGRLPYADLFQRAGARHGVDPALLAAVASVESGFRPDAVSSAGARGLMQLMPATASGLGVRNAFDPEQAIDGAARLLAGNLQRYGSVELALAAYNAGPGAVAKYGGIPPYAETQAYVPKVMARLQEYRR